MSGVLAGELYDSLRAMLNAAGIADALESRVIFESACDGADPRREPGRPIPAAQAARARELARRRAAGYPLQYIAGRWPFLDFELELGEGVLIPRPETEDVAQRAIELLKDIKQPAALDLCSGTGCLAVAIARALPRAAVAALERSAEALRYLNKNVAALAPEIVVVNADVFEYQRALAPSALALIVSNPPYVHEADYAALAPELFYEPKTALVAPRGGLGFYEHIAPGYKAALRPGGALLFEVGHDQAGPVAAILKQAGYVGVETAKDRFGADRMLWGFNSVE